MSVLRDIEGEERDESELPDSLDSDEIVDFGAIEAKSTDELPTEEEE